ncbi:MAG: chemotaxis protein CheX [Desulfobacula sp.]|uniref:chemotaxis protein CheX n=1 Tax=Desulfobacula sp. TaxID=2593537 RepID=UPI0025C11750|nr:chemotaxis protein CheX [Desulfobacula sp.]MCD4722674.1 chemotaxis protein CheX [Desulfobacula sp.]
MDVKLINPFINATINVLETMAFMTVNAGQPYVKKDNIAIGDVSGILGLTGVANGTIAVTFEEKCILAVVSNMFGETMSELNNEIADAVGELTNMISGQARRELEEMGKVFKAAIPSVVTGKNHSIMHFTNGPKIAIPFNTDNGDFTIEVCFER